jgi:hypothetical protein
MPTLETKASGSAQAFGFTGLTTPEFILVEELFDVVQWTGDGSPRTISTNLVNLSAGGGMVWIKNLSTASGITIYDTKSGTGKYLTTVGAYTTDAQSITAFGNKTFTIGNSAVVNTVGNEYQATIIKIRAGFFDIQTYTGTGSNRTVGHSLGVAPSLVFTKSTSTTGNLYMQSSGNTGTTDFGDASQNNSYYTPSATYMTSLPNSNNLNFGTGVANSNTVGYITFMFGQSAIFGPNQNESLFLSYNQNTGSIPNLYSTKYALWQFIIHFAAQSTPSNWVYYYGLNSYGGTVQNFWQSAIETGSLVRPTQAGIWGEFPTSGQLGNQVGVNPDGGATGGGVFFADNVIVQKYHTLPSTNTLYSYVAVSGTSQSFDVGFDWELGFVYVDGQDSSGFFFRTAFQTAGNVVRTFNVTGVAITTTNLSAGFTPIATTRKGNLKSIGTISTGGTLNRVQVWKCYKNYAQAWRMFGTTGVSYDNNFNGNVPNCIFGIYTGNAFGTGAGNRLSSLVVSFPVLGVNGIPLQTTNAANSSLSSVNTSLVVSGSTFSMTGIGGTEYWSGMWWRDLVNVIATGTYTGNATARAITLSGWTTPPTSVWIFSNFVTGGVANIMSLGVTQSIGAFMYCGGSGTSLTNITDITQYSNSPSFGFQLASGTTQNVNAREYYYIAFK